MSSKNVKRRNVIGSGNCVGTINGTEPFVAGLVELSEETFPLPHGQAYVMFARQRSPTPTFTTKELSLSFTKGLPNNTYDLAPDSHEVRVTFADNSDPAKPVIFTQCSGQAVLVYDAPAGVLSGDLIKLVLENRDDDVLTEIELDIRFQAKGDIVTLNRLHTFAA